MSPVDPVEAEATRQSHVVAAYKGHEYKLPLDADDWPLSLIWASVGVESEKLVTNAPVVLRALQRLLGDQWPDYLHAFPRRRDLLPTSQAFAAAVGFPGDHRDAAFGALPRLLAVIKEYPAAVEATLGAMGLDYRDRWRFDADHFRRLTLRQIYVRLSHMPPNSPLAIAENDGKIPHTATDLLLMDLFEVTARKTHPSRPLTSEQRAVREATQKKTKEELVAEYRQRHAPNPTRRTAIATAQANARPRKAAHASKQQEAKAQTPADPADPQGGRVGGGSGD